MDNSTHGRVTRVMQWLGTSLAGDDSYESILNELLRKMECIVGPHIGRNYRAPNPEIVSNTEFFEYVVDRVADYWATDKSLLMSRSKSGEINKIRQVMHYLAMTLSGRTQMDAARFFGRERTTLVYSREKVVARMLASKDYRMEINWLEQDCRAFIRRKDRERRARSLPQAGDVAKVS